MAVGAAMTGLRPVIEGTNTVFAAGSSTTSNNAEQAVLHPAAPNANGVSGGGVGTLRGTLLPRSYFLGSTV